MSIFKETFRDFVSQQIKLREHIITMGDKDKGRFASSTLDLSSLGGKKVNIDPGAFFTNTINRQCVIRMSSGVDLKPTSSNILEGGKYENKSDLVNEGLARRWVLEGGTLLSLKKGDKWVYGMRRGFPGASGKLKSGRQRSFGFPYGDPLLRANAAGYPDKGYGIVPMPGITKAEIKTKSAYGSLREAKVEFVCHNQRQLEILELLYMRPGYPILLEWGWTTYIGNNGKRSSEFPHISKFFHQDITQEYVNREVIANKAKTGGNYDALMAICKNFQYTARPDGGYDCSTELIAVGEVIESIKSERSSVYDKDSEEWKEYDEVEIFLEKVLAYNKAQNPTFYQKFTSKGFWFDMDLGKKRRLDKAKEIKRSIKEHLPPVENQPKESIFPWVLDAGTKMTSDNGEEIENNFAACYIRWDALAHLFNVSFIPKNDKNGDPIFTLQTNMIVNEDRSVDKPNGKRVEPLLYNQFIDPVDGSPLDLSLDPSVGLLPHQLDQLRIKDHSLGRLIIGICAIGFVPTMGIGAKIIQEEFEKMAADPILKDVEGRMIGKVYFNVQRLLDTYRNMRYDSEGMTIKTFNLYDYIKKIWDMIDDACAGTHNFELSVDHERPNLVKVIDLSFNVGTEKNLDYEKIIKLNIQSNDSIVRDFSYHTSIPSAMTATIATAAQAPNNMENIEKTSFSALHRSIKNRFTVANETPQKLTKEQKEKNKEDDKKEAKAAKEEYTRKKEEYNSGKKELKEYQLEILEGDYAKINSTGNNKSEKMVNVAKGVLKTTISAAQFLTSHDKKGIPKPNPTDPRSAIIPLKFNATMDGIGGIIIGNVFRLKESRLPRGYKEANVGFVVTGENQSITPGGDWTTSFTGQMILLDDPSSKNNKGKGGGNGDGQDGEGDSGNFNENDNATSDGEESENKIDETSDSDENSQEKQLEQQDKCPEGQHYEEGVGCVIDDIEVKENKEEEEEEGEKDFTNYEDWKQNILKYSDTTGYLDYYMSDWDTNGNNGRYVRSKIPVGTEWNDTNYSGEGRHSGKIAVGSISVQNVGDLLFTNTMGYIKSGKAYAQNASTLFKGNHYLERLDEEFTNGVIGVGPTNVVYDFEEVKGYWEDMLAHKQNMPDLKSIHKKVIAAASEDPRIVQEEVKTLTYPPEGGWNEEIARAQWGFDFTENERTTSTIIYGEYVDYDITISQDIVEDFSDFNEL